jgi:hypothetical protein
MVSADDLRDPDDEFWNRNLETCRRLRVAPVSAERARGKSENSFSFSAGRPEPTQR